MNKDNFEQSYLNIVKDILNNGDLKKTRNGNTKSLFGKMLIINELIYNKFPILTTRRIFYKSGLGEYSALIRGVSNIRDFEKFGCNYWKLWAKENGNINIDYGNVWKDFNGFNQMEDVLFKLKNNKNDRRMIITGWKPDNLKDLSLPCCHTFYNFNVINNKLNLLWIQRSADFMVGVPTDIIFAAVMLLNFSNLSNIKPGQIKMIFTDAHIYEEHFEKTKILLKREKKSLPNFRFNKQKDLYSFVPEDLKIIKYKYNDKINFYLKR